jgi:hypothetical protein
MKTKINPKKIVGLRYSLKQTGSYKWYEHRDAVYESKWFGHHKVKLISSQDQGWCSRGGNWAHYIPTDEALSEYGYEVVTMPTGDKVCYQLPSIKVYLDGKREVSQTFQTDEELFAMIEDLETEAGQKFTDIN